MSRTKPLRRKTALGRGRKLAPVNRERKAEMHARNFGAEADRVRAMPCLACAKQCGVCSTLGRRECWHHRDREAVAAHVTARGMGAVKGGRFDLVPLCTAHHREAGEAGTGQRAAFEQRYGVDLRRIADDLALEHPRPLGIRGLADLFVQEVDFGEGPALVALDRHERDALLGWVHREMGREVDTAACMLADTDGPDDEQAFREALTHCVAQALGGPFVEDDRLARTLCEAAAERFGGWPT